MGKERRSCNQSEQEEHVAESLSPLHAYFSSLINSQQSPVEATLIQDNAAAYSRSSQAKRLTFANRKPILFCQQSIDSSTLASSEIFSALDDTLLLETNRWESESTMDSSDHSDSVDGSPSSRIKAISGDKPRLPKRSASPIIMLDES